MKKDGMIIVSGVQPTGEMHIGNWAGALRNWVNLQEENAERFFFIADYHSMTIDADPEERRRRILDLAATMLAIGLDPKKSTLFVQSDVPEVTELCWIFNTVTPVAEMERMTQYKDKAARNEKNINMGLLDYPVLQAVDIVIYGGNAVPVGQDQVQHVETTRVIARNFNKRFGETFPEPKPLLTETPNVMSLTEPGKKMSKSHGPKSYIALDDEPEAIIEKMKRVPTEASGKGTYAKYKSGELAADEEMGGIINIFQLHDLMMSAEHMKNCEYMKAGALRYGELKEHVGTVIADFFADYRAKKKALLKDEDRIHEIFAAGAKKARAIAQATMEDVRRKTGLR